MVSVGHRKTRQGFTLIELLVAVAILMIIVLIAVQLFSKARTAWDTGSRIADACLKGRTVADFVAQELSQAVLPTNGTFAISSNAVSFLVLRQLASASDAVIVTQQFSFSYSDGVASFGTNELCSGLSSLSFSPNTGYRPDSGELPLYVDVNVTIISEDRTVTSLYQSRASFPNWDRYRF